MQYTLHVCGTRQVNRITVDTLADLVRLTLGIAAAWKAVPTYGETLYHRAGEPSGKIESASRSHVRQYQHAKRALIQRWTTRAAKVVVMTRSAREEYRFACRCSDLTNISILKMIIRDRLFFGRITKYTGGDYNAFSYDHYRLTEHETETHTQRSSLA